MTNETTQTEAEKTAFKMGQAARLAGSVRVPCRDRDLMALAATVSASGASILPILVAFSRGWDVEASAEAWAAVAKA